MIARPTEPGWYWKFLSKGIGWLIYEVYIDPATGELFEIGGGESQGFKLGKCDTPDTQWSTRISRSDCGVLHSGPEDEMDRSTTAADDQLRRKDGPHQETPRTVTAFQMAASAHMDRLLPDRTREVKLLKLAEEVGEACQAHNKSKGQDKILMEVADVILCALDLFHVEQQPAEFWLLAAMEKNKKREEKNGA
jgi:NTP pyrophosphatase (non-canonical NTP hydrolase)